MRCKSMGSLGLISLSTNNDIAVYRIQLGTVDLADADVEWQLASYTRTAGRRLEL